MQMARQTAACELLQPQALLAWLAMGDEMWIQCSTEHRALSVRQIQDLVLAKTLPARLEFRAPTNGRTTQVADLIVLEYETLGARHLCSGEHCLVVLSMLSFKKVSPCRTSFLKEPKVMLQPMCMCISSKTKVQACVVVPHMPSDAARLQRVSLYAVASNSDPMQGPLCNRADVGSRSPCLSPATSNAGSAATALLLPRCFTSMPALQACRSIVGSHPFLHVKGCRALLT